MDTAITNIEIRSPKLGENHEKQHFTTTADAMEWLTIGSVLGTYLTVREELNDFYPGVTLDSLRNMTDQELDDKNAPDSVYELRDMARHHALTDNSPLYIRDGQIEGKGTEENCLIAACHWELDDNRATIDITRADGSRTEARNL